MLPYGKQWIDENDIDEIIKVLRSDWLTTGPKIAEFEKKFSTYVGTKEAVAVSSGTAALHAAMHVLNIKPKDEVIVPAITFVASPNCVVYRGGKPVFADVYPETLLIDIDDVKKKITKKTKAIIAVDYAGHPCNYEKLNYIAESNNIAIVADACHSIGGSYQGRLVGSLAELSTFSFHPVKSITSGEGGMITTNDCNLAQRMRIFRNHGITNDHRQRELNRSWLYEMVDLGYNYRLTDFQCALGISQLVKLPEWIKRRQGIATQYNMAFSELSAVEPLSVEKDVNHGYHLYVVKLDLDQLKCDRMAIFSKLRDKGLGVNVHYIPVHLHPYYKNNFNTKIGLCPVAESSYERILSLPIFPKMTQFEIEKVIAVVDKVIKEQSI